MRVLCAIGATAFAYLAIIPASLIGSTLDSACAGPGCETSLLSKVVFTIVYALCLGVLATTAVLMAQHAVIGSGSSLRRIPKALAASAGALALACVALFAVAAPLGAVVTLTVGALTYGSLKLAGRRSARGPRGEGPDDREALIAALPAWPAFQRLPDKRRDD